MFLPFFSKRSTSKQLYPRKGGGGGKGGKGEVLLLGSSRKRAENSSDLETKVEDHRRGVELRSLYHSAEKLQEARLLRLPTVVEAGR